jgi:putative inorganic carbon (HCO3(-)) transporter
MSATRIFIGLTFFIVALLGAAYAIVAFESSGIAILLYVVGIGLAMVLIEPFIGLANYLVFLYLRPQEFVPGFVGMPVMLILGGATFGLTILHAVFKRQKIFDFKIPQNLIMVWFFLAIAVSHLTHFYAHGALNSSMDFLSVFIMYLLIVNLVNTQTRVKITLYLLLGMTLFLALQGIVQYYTGFGIAGQEAYQDERIRAIGIFSDPNDLALALLIILPFLFYKITRGGNPLVKLAVIISSIIIIYAIFLTQSRGGILSLGLLVFFMLCKRYGRMVGIVGGIFIMAGIFIAGPARMGDISPEEASIYGRVEAWSLGLDLFKSNPLFGVGADRFIEYHFRTAHNSFLLCASELGLFGLFPWVMLILISLKNSFFVATQEHVDTGSGLKLCAESIFFGIVAFVSAAFFLSRTYNELLYILVGLSVAVTGIMMRGTDGEFLLIEKRDIIYTFLIIVGCLIFIQLFLYWAW